MSRRPLRVASLLGNGADTLMAKVVPVLNRSRNPLENAKAIGEPHPLSLVRILVSSPRNTLIGA